MSNSKIPSRTISHPIADTSNPSTPSQHSTPQPSASTSHAVPHALQSLAQRPTPRTAAGDANAAEAPPFAGRDYQKGDLVYGLEKGLDGGIGRKHYIDYRFRARMTPSRIDEFNILRQEQSRPQKMPAAEESSFKASLSAHEKYHTALGGSQDDNSAVRRKVKGGLDWATRVADKHVHFVLDSMDMDAVVNKNFIVDKPAGSSDNLAPGETKNRSYTGAELRWVYRNKDDPRVQKNVHFWHNRQKAPPPWQEYTKQKTEFTPDGPKYTSETVDVEEQWSHYVPKRKPQLPE